jgi:hypothetical protein
VSAEPQKEAAQQQLQELDARLRTVLPEDYRDSYEALEPVPMKSAGLKFGADGKVAWNEIWGSFCNLAMAGGPPHKGRLLEPGTVEQVAAQSDQYREVVDEICRGVTMATELTCYGTEKPGWIRVKCYSESMTGWLLRAITMENVAVTAGRLAVELPAGPHYRLEKEIKNVVTVIAKTSHYWLGHMPRSQRYEVASLFARLAAESPLVEPAAPTGSPAANDGPPAPAAMIRRIQHDTGFSPTNHTYRGWLGLACPTVAAAVWLMRALVVSNVLARREDTSLFVPVNPRTDPEGTRVCDVLAHVHGLAATRGVL